MGNGSSSIISGSRIAEDFDRVKLPRRASVSALAAELTITPSEAEPQEHQDHHLLDRPCTVLVRRDVNRKATVIFDQETMMPLYITTQKRELGVDSVTTDRHGRVLFLTTAPKKGQRFIYKAPRLDEAPASREFVHDQEDDEDDRQTLSYATPYKKKNNRHPKDDEDNVSSASSSASSTRSNKSNRSSSSRKNKNRGKNLLRFASFRRKQGNLQRSDSADTSTTSSTTSSSTSLRNLFGGSRSNGNNNNNTASLRSSPFKPTLANGGGDLPCAAQIDIDHKGSTVSAFLSVVCWKACGPEPIPLYKGIRIPNVAQGVLIVNMQGGDVVGKAFQQSKKKKPNGTRRTMEPVIQIAAGADRACVVALASALLGDL